MLRWIIRIPLLPPVLAWIAWDWFKARSAEPIRDFAFHLVSGESVDEIRIYVYEEMDNDIEAIGDFIKAVSNAEIN
jgi:hypothetical protein